MALQTDQEKVAHILRRFALGASEAEMDYYGKNGPAGAINLLLDHESVEDNFADEPLRNKDGKLVANPRFGQQAFYAQLLTTKRPLLYKMTIFWHDHFATSAQKVASGPAMFDHLLTLRDNATGTFPGLLTAVSKDPAMLFWLDNQDNVKGKPNENFAREVMELFTLGIGNYSETDIQEGARAFTGWTYGSPNPRNPNSRVFVTRGELPRINAQYIFDQPNHDAGAKAFLGKSGSFNGDDVIKILCDNPRTAYYITEKIWNWFVAPDPDAATIEKFAAKFRASGLSIKALLRAIMESPEFYSDKVERAVIKNPLDFCLPSARQLGIGAEAAKMISEATDEAQQRRAGASVRPIVQATTSMGMEIMYPPDVSGWAGGAAWISSATMVERIKWSSVLFQRAAQKIGFPMFPLLMGSVAPAAAVDRLLSLFDAKLDPEKKTALIDAARKATAGGRVTAQNANLVAEEVCKLIFGSPEFQFM
jgi:uncharacterized protein (DUF1800 family)